MTAPQMLSDRYELGDTLGYGGMSEVHAGRDIRLGRDVAVKVLRADLARDPQFQERFRREAQNAAALNHPAIVAVYDTGETQTEYGPLPYIVMEYVDGRTLRDIVKTEGPMPGKRAMEVMADVCAALDFSHRHSIIHRDVKPANVMITKNGAVKVMDFGIARALADGQAAVTQTSAVIGTAQYLSPEQARGEMVDARSDVYSAGCVLFELLAGEPPFTGDSPVAVAYQHVREDPSAPSTLNPEVTPQLDAIVLKALAKNPANRYQSAAEMRADLVKVLAGSRPSAPMVMTDEDRTSIMTGARPTPALAGNEDYRDYDDDDYEDEEEERRAARKKAWKRVGLVVLCLAVLAGAAWLTTSLLNKKADTVAVPSLVGQDQASATRALQGANLKINIQPVYCENKPDNSKPDCTPDQVNHVVSTDPPGNTQVAPLSTVTVRIGQNPRASQIPDVKGKSIPDATQAIQGAGFQVSPDTTQTQETSDSSLVGKVISTNPPIGTSLARGSQPVTLIIGKAQTKVQVPDSSGQQYDAAAANLSQLGLTPVKSAKDGSEPAGTVVGQTPDAGTSVVKGSKVTLFVSKGNQFTMPDITGKTQADAQQMLQQQDKWTGQFNVQQKPTTDPTQNGQIATSSPNAGGTATTDQTITITVYQLQSGGGGGPTFPTIPPGFPGGGG